MSNRASSSSASSQHQLAAPTSNRYDNRRQQRARGAGKHEIIPRKINFGSQQQGIPSSIASSSSSARTPAHQKSSTQETSVSSTPAHHHTGRNEDLSSTPAESVRSGRFIPSSSPSKFIHPLLLADQSHRHAPNNMLSMPSPSINGRPVGNMIEQHRSERLRGAGTHRIEPRLIQFSNGRVSDVSSIETSAQSMADFPIQQLREQRRQERLRGAGTHQVELMPVQVGKGRVSDAPSSDSGRDVTASPGLLDRFMNSMFPSRSDAGLHDDAEIDNGISKADWIKQRRDERRRGAGAHAIMETKAHFGSISQQSDTLSSLLDSGSVVDEEVDEQGDRTVTGHFSPPSESTPKGADGQTQSFQFVDTADGEGVSVMDFDQQDDNQSQMTQSPGSMAAQRIMDKRKSKRQGSPSRDTLRKTKSTRRAGTKKGPPRRIVDLNMFEGADETIAGQADETLQEQREAAFTAPEPPSWTFPKTSVTKEELSAMKTRVQEMVTLALGNEAGAVRTVKVNDADVLWSVLKRELYSAQQDHHPSSVISTFLDQLSDSLLATFTHLSQQSAERSQLIHHLIQARRRNLHIRKEVFQKRSQVLKVARAMQVLKTQELKRVQQEEEEERSLRFLTRLQQVSHEWC